MISYSKGENLIFLISQPRAGSTLTQRMLGAHPDIYTQSEPWVMLHPMHAFKPQGLQSAFDSGLYTTALRDFIGSLPDGETHYKNSIASTYNGFYNAILEKEDKKLFLDKTPRYYHIIPELAEYFPEAKFIFLWRNPAAVVSSILSSWVKKNWHTMSQYRTDLLLAPQAMTDGINLLGNRAMSFRFENLIREPEYLIKKICDFLGLKYTNALLEYYRIKYPAWKFGDEKTLKNTTLPDESRIETWKLSLKHTQSWRVIHEYIMALGEATVSNMGYSWVEILKDINECKPDENIESASLPLSILLDNSRETILESRQLFYQLESLRKVVNQKDEQIQRLEALQSRMVKEQSNSVEKFENINAEFVKCKDSLKKATEEIDSQKQLLKNREEWIRNLENASEAYKHALEQKDTLLAKAKEEALSFKTAHSQIETQVERLEAELKSYQDLITQKDLLINQSREMVEKTGALNVSMENLLNQKNIQIEELNQRLKQREGMLEKLDQAIEKLHDVNNKMQSDIQEKVELLRTLNDKLIHQTIKTDEALSAIEIKETELLKLKEAILRKDKQLNEKTELIRQIEKSYTFRTGKVLLWPFKKILGK